jgi:CBS domain-containing protein
MKVRVIMTTDVATATPETTLEDIATMMRDEDTGAIPVLDDNELVGIVTDRDIVIRCIAEGKDPVETTVEDVLSENLETIEPESEIEQARDLMSRRQIRRLPVVEDGELVGMLSIGDMAVKSDTDLGDTLENVSEGVKVSGTNAKRAGRTGSTRAAGSEATVRDIASVRKGARRATGGAQHQGGRDGREQGISNRSRGQEQRRQNKVVGKRSEARGGTRRRAS